jgi:hypothetical protein
MPREDSPVRTDTRSPHKTTDRNRHSTETISDSPGISGPHVGRDCDGALDHRYYRCERCGLESTDPRLQEGCWRCGAGRERDGDDREEGDCRG